MCDVKSLTRNMNKIRLPHSSQMMIDAWAKEGLTCPAFFGPTEVSEDGQPFSA
jgi:hypothetical protein